MNNRYYIMRHGESIANRKGLIICDKKDAINHYGLTALGAERVLEVAVRSRLTSDSLIISSDFLRARETAEIVEKIIDTDAPVEFRHELRERCFGDWHLSDDCHYDLVWHNDLSNPNKKTNDVETVNEVLHRVISLIDDLEQTHIDRTILLVGHGDVLQILMCYFKGIDVRFHRSLLSLSNAEIRVLPNEVILTSKTA